MLLSSMETFEPGLIHLIGINVIFNSPVDSPGSSNSFSLSPSPLDSAEKEVQDSSCRKSGGIPQTKLPPKIWWIKGVENDILAISLEGRLDEGVTIGGAGHG